MNDIPTPSELYAVIRSSNSEWIGKHWNGIGVYLGDDVWADPDYFGMEGQYEMVDYPLLLQQEARSRPNSDPSAKKRKKPRPKP